MAPSGDLRPLSLGLQDGRQPRQGHLVPLVGPSAVVAGVLAVLVRDTRFVEVVAEQAVTRETIGYARELLGEDAVGEIVGAIPGLGQFI